MEEDFTFDIPSDPSMYSGEADAAAAAAGGALCVIWIAGLVIGIIMIVSLWKVFTKAGKPGWASIVPIYNIIILLEVINRPMWWVVLFLIPIANLVACIMTSIDLAKAFGKGTGFAIGLILFPFIFYPMLGFGNAKYKGGSSTPVSSDQVKVEDTPASMNV